MKEITNQIKELTTNFAPNVHIHKRYGKEVTVRYHPKAQAKACSLVRQMHIEQGTTADYKTLCQFHYRASRLPPPRKIFTLKRKDEICATIVYCYPSPVMFGRSKVWKGNIQQLQKKMSIISRVIVHPKYRSIGLGEKIVKETLPQAGTPYVETVAVMAKYNPFFEKAGMTRIAESKQNPHLTSALAELEAYGFETALLTATGLTEQKISTVGAEKVRNVLVELSKRDATIRRRLGNLKNVYPRHEEFTQKVNQSGTVELAGMLKKLSFCAQSKIYLFWKNR